MNREFVFTYLVTHLFLATFAFAQTYINISVVEYSYNSTSVSRYLGYVHLDDAYAGPPQVETFGGPLSPTYSENSYLIYWENPCIHPNISTTLLGIDIPSNITDEIGFAVLLDLNPKRNCSFNEALDIATNELLQFSAAMKLEAVFIQQNGQNESDFSSLWTTNSRYQTATFKLPGNPPTIQVPAEIRNSTLTYTWQSIEREIGEKFTIIDVQYNYTVKKQPRRKVLEPTAPTTFPIPMSQYEVVVEIAQWVFPAVIVVVIGFYIWKNRNMRREFNNIELHPIAAPQSETLVVLTEKDLASIPKVKFSELPKEDENAMFCSVCLDVFVDADELRVLPGCKHTFHPPCIDEWLLTRATGCPNCRLDTRIALGIVEQPNIKEIETSPSSLETARMENLTSSSSTPGSDALEGTAVISVELRVDVVSTGSSEQKNSYQGVI